MQIRLPTLALEPTGDETWVSVAHKWTCVYQNKKRKKSYAFHIVYQIFPDRINLTVQIDISDKFETIMRWHRCSLLWRLINAVDVLQRMLSKYKLTVFIEAIYKREGHGELLCQGCMSRYWVVICIVTESPGLESKLVDRNMKRIHILTLVFSWCPKAVRINAFAKVKRR